MYPKLLIRLWMSSKKNASMIVGLLMGRETRLILGQVSLDLLFRKKTFTRKFVGEINEKTVDIKAGSFTMPSETNSNDFESFWN